MADGTLWLGALWCRFAALGEGEWSGPLCPELHVRH